MRCTTWKTDGYDGIPSPELNIAPPKRRLSDYQSVFARLDTHVIPHVEGASSSGYPDLSPLVRSAFASLGLSHTLYLRLEEKEIPSEYLFGKN